MQLLHKIMVYAMKYLVDEVGMYADDHMFHILAS